MKSSNGADELIIDDDNFWVCANQAADCRDRSDPGRVIAKLGDFD